MNEREKRLRIYRAISANPEWVEILQDALALQEKEEEQEAKGHLWLGFEWFDIHTNPQTLKKMVTSKLLNVTFSSHSSTNYKIADAVLVGEAIQAISEPYPSLPPNQCKKCHLTYLIPLSATKM
jgi:hypothetical protein